MAKTPLLSIVILNYNTKELLNNCLASLDKIKGEVPFEVIIVDNASTDNPLEIISKFVKKDPETYILIKNDSNNGFAAGNNLAKKVCKGRYILFLNPDTEVYPQVLSQTVGYLQQSEKVGALTCKTVLPNGQLDPDARRSFPTPWVAFTHFSGLGKLFRGSKIFDRYWYGYKSADEIHEIEVLQGAFFLSRKSILDKLGWFDEDYFLDGEDIDLCWRIHQAGYKIIYYPSVSILHIKGASKGKNKQVKVKNFSTRKKSVLAGINAMEIFYKKRLWGNYPLFVNVLVIIGIKALKLLRITKVYLSI